MSQPVILRWASAIPLGSSSRTCSIWSQGSGLTRS